MIDIHHLIENPDRYKQELTKRGKDALVVDALIIGYQAWKSKQQEYEQLRREQNEFNTTIVNLPDEQKSEAIQKVKGLSQDAKNTENEAKELRNQVDKLILKIPQLSWDDCPIGESDEQNVLIGYLGERRIFNFEPKSYWDLPYYKSQVSQEAGVKAMGARGYYLKGNLALFHKALFDHVMDIVLSHGLELMYVPLMLNSKVLTGTGHLPDFDGQQYEVPIDENTNFYLIGSSEPSIMGYYMDSHLGYLHQPIHLTCVSSCFRKEAGSYGKDQQGILRVHQFEKIEMVAIASKEDSLELFDKHGQIIEEVYNSFGLYGRKVEVCTGDLPHKHYRQIDYEAWFPSSNTFRETHSNGNAADFQNRGLRITQDNSNGERITPWGLNCTAITMRTGLAILEQYQEEDGRVRLPDVLAERMKIEYL